MDAIGSDSAKVDEPPQGSLLHSLHHFNHSGADQFKNHVLTYTLIEHIVEVEAHEHIFP